MPTGAPDYFKSILLYGLYDGQVVPLACDEQGRLILITEPVTPFGRTGTILLHEEWSDGLVHVVTATLGTGASVSLYDEDAFRGGYSVKLLGGSEAANYANVHWYFYPYRYSKLGIEFYLRVSPFLGYLNVQLQTGPGADAYRAQLRLNISGQKWQIYDGATLAWVDILTDYLQAEGQRQFVGFKLVADVENGIYHSFRVYDSLIDLSDYALPVQAAAMYPHTWAKIEAVSMVGGDGWALIDNIILTQDES